MTSPFPELAPSLLPYALLAVAMLVGNLYFLLRLFPRQGGPPDLATVILVVGLLVMTTGLWSSVLYAILSPGDASTVSVFIAGNSMMAVVGTWVIGLFLRAEEKRLPARGWTWPLLLAVLVVGNELLMGAAFTLAQRGTEAYSGLGPLGVVALTSDAVDSVWFFWAMLANMVVLLLWLPLERPERTALLGLTASAGIGPWVVVDPLLGAVAMAIIMTTVFVLMFEHLGRSSVVSVAYLRTAIAIAAAFGLMALGEFLFLANVDPVWGSFSFAFPTALVMGAEVVFLARWALARRGPSDPEVAPLYQRPRDTATFLALGFVTEWLMSGSILMALNGPGLLFPGGIGLLSGGSIGDALALLIEGIATVTASPVFLGLMGVEMGALVVTRMRRATERAQRARLGMALGTYGVYTVLAPALVGTWALVPGAWPNVGAFGPARALFVPAIVGSYAVLVVLAVLFGRGAYCSVMCPSAVMYGGTFSQRLIPSLRESPTARHHVLGGRWKGLALAIAVSSWVLLGLVVSLSIWDTSFGGSAYWGGFDPSILYAAAIWNVVWYAFFISIPYVGMSPSRNWGFCSTGTLLGAVSYVGLYRKEALDREVCRACVTRDCGKACEVGLVEMPAVLARDGVFRSMKCVGAHDCEVACPYGNLVSRDVRDTLRSALGLPDRFAHRRADPLGASLPMSRPAVVRAAPAAEPP